MRGGGGAAIAHNILITTSIWAEISSGALPICCVSSCQANVIDDAAGTFTFPRVPLLVR
jgi:hypothetical protein